MVISCPLTLVVLAYDLADELRWSHTAGIRVLDNALPEADRPAELDGHVDEVPGPPEEAVSAVKEVLVVEESHRFGQKSHGHQYSPPVPGDRMEHGLALTCVRPPIPRPARNLLNLNKSLPVLMFFVEVNDRKLLNRRVHPPPMPCYYLRPHMNDILLHDTRTVICRERVLLTITLIPPDEIAFLHSGGREGHLSRE